jgi:hypothetical protein
MVMMHIFTIWNQYGWDDRSKIVKMLVENERNSGVDERIEMTWRRCEYPRRKFGKGFLI